MRAAPVGTGQQRCGTCMRVKPLDAFVAYMTRDGEEHVGAKCTTCGVYAAARVAKDERVQFIRMTNAAFLAQGCAICGEPAHEIDHVTGIKTRAMSAYTDWAPHLAAYLEELTRCQPLCIVHHREKNARTNRKSPPRPHVQRNIAYIKQLKLNLGTCDLCSAPCTEANVIGFDLDHLDPMAPRIMVSNMIGYSLARIDAEVAKCRLLCHACHKAHTLAQRKERALPRLKRLRVAKSALKVSAKQARKLGALVVFV